jgi:aminomethyltransferase
VSGAETAAFLDDVLTNRMADLEPGRARYTLLLDENAGIVDDMIVYAVAQQEMLVVPNAANVVAVKQQLASQMTQTNHGDSVRIDQRPWVTLAVQGPLSTEVVREVFPNLPDLKYMRCWADGDVVVSRSGYTGEVGYEVFGPPERGRELWDRLLAACRARGGGPCGLGARDTLRLEMGYPLHGNDIDRDTTPHEAGLEWAVASDKPRFAGKDALRHHAVRKELVGLRMEDRLIPRHGHVVLREGEPIGRVTSGGFSPTLRRGIALASVAPASVNLDDLVEVDVRGKLGSARVVRPPFVDRSPKG